MACGNRVGDGEGADSKGEVNQFDSWALGEENNIPDIYLHTFLKVNEPGETKAIGSTVQ